MAARHLDRPLDGVHADRTGQLLAHGVGPRRVRIFASRHSPPTRRTSQRRSEKGVGGSITLEVGTGANTVGGRVTGWRSINGCSSSLLRFLVCTSSSGALMTLILSAAGESYLALLSAARTSAARESYLSVVVGGARVGAAI